MCFLGPKLKLYSFNFFLLLLERLITCWSWASLGACVILLMCRWLFCFSGAMGCFWVQKEPLLLLCSVVNLLFFPSFAVVACFHSLNFFSFSCIWVWHPAGIKNPFKILKPNLFLSRPWLLLTPFNQHCNLLDR